MNRNLQEWAGDANFDAKVPDGFEPYTPTGMILTDNTSFFMSYRVFASSIYRMCTTRICDE